MYKVRRNSSKLLEPTLCSWSMTMPPTSSIARVMARAGSLGTNLYPILSRVQTSLRESKMAVSDKMAQEFIDEIGKLDGEAGLTKYAMDRHAVVNVDWCRVDVEDIFLVSDSSKFSVSEPICLIVIVISLSRQNIN